MIRGVFAFVQIHPLIRAQVLRMESQGVEKISAQEGRFVSNANIAWIIAFNWESGVAFFLRRIYLQTLYFISGPLLHGRASLLLLYFARLSLRKTRATQALVRADSLRLQHAAKLRNLHSRKWTASLDFIIAVSPRRFAMGRRVDLKCVLVGDGAVGKT